MYNTTKESNQLNGGTPQKYSLRQHFQQHKIKSKPSPISLPVSRLRSGQESTNMFYRSPPLNSNRAASYKQSQTDHFQVDCFNFGRNLTEYRQQVQVNLQRNNQTPSTTNSVQYRGAQKLNFGKNGHRTECLTKFSLRNVKKNHHRKVASRVGAFGNAKMPQQRNVTEHTNTPFSNDCRPTEERYSDHDSSKYSLRNKNRKTFRPEVLISLKYEDLVNPLQNMKSQQRLNQPLASDTVQNVQSKAFYSIRKMNSDGCRCQPKSSWVVRWLEIVGPVYSEKPRRIKDEKAFEANVKQVQRDLHRTQPSHPAFQSQQMLEMLKLVLLGYAQLDEEVGYVQGMNFVAAALVYQCQNVEDALRIFSYLMKVCGYRKLFLGDLGLGTMLANKFHQELRKLVFDLYNYLEEEGVEIEMFISSWYFSLCGSFVPLDAMHIFIDKFITKGFAGINELLVTLMLQKKEKLMELEDSQLMLEFSNMKLCDYGEEVDWQDLKEKAEKINLNPIQI